jgi:hypothetical protein
MDATIVAAMISAGAKIAPWIYDKWSGAPRTPADEKIEGFVAENYDNLRALLTDHCVKVLKGMEDGQNHTLDELREYVYPNLNFQSYDDAGRFTKEFEYRLRYLQMVGVITQPTSEYYITKVGMTFLHTARIRRDYFRVLF